jgi:alpha-glucosidase (family GH31 glycosyl hydrolase)
LKQLYSVLVDLNGKGTFFRPVYFEFPEDAETLKDDIIETQFLLGKYLLSAPIVE